MAKNNQHYFKLKFCFLLANSCYCAERRYAECRVAQSVIVEQLQEGQISTIVSSTTK